MNNTPSWKKIIAFLSDLIGSFFIFGYTISYFTGNINNDGFNLQGIPALFAVILIVSYFVIFNKYFGGTLGKKIFGIKNV